MTRIKGAARTVQTIDYQTGEILTEQNEFKFATEPSFFKTYCDDLGYLHQLNNGTKSVLYFLAKRMNYQNQIIITIDLKLEACEEIKIGLNMVNKAISTLYKKDILIKKNKERRSIYIVNPKYFAKGTWKDIKQLRTEIVYNDAGRFILTEIG
jgi:hypothetical protein